MKIYEVTDRARLSDKLLQIWESSVRATHGFLSDKEIERIKSYVPQAISEVDHLAVAEDGSGEPIAFAGAQSGRLEMLFVSADERGRGAGRQLLEYAEQHFGVTELTVNEKNPQAVGFYEHLGFKPYKRTALDEQGAPYPLIYMRKE